MFTKAFTFGGLTVLATVAALLTAEPGRAFFPPPPPPPPPPHAGGLHPGFPHYPLPFHGGYPFYHPYSQGYTGYYPYHGPSYVQPVFDYGSALNPPAQPVLTAEEQDVRVLLAASGVPTDEGRPVWPLALRVLPGSEAPSLRGQIDALLQVAANQAARGRPNTAIVQELAQGTDRLRNLLRWHREWRGGLALNSYEEAERFLDKLGGGRTLLRVQLAPAPSGPGGEGKGGSDAPDYRR
jgi:hypothetical protein